MDQPPSESQCPPDLARYSRQVLFDGVGVAGQRQLRHSAVALVGCGALGATAAELLVRAGIGYLRIIDRDFVEIDNLQRQALFDERDVTDNLPKAEAAARKLRRINSGVEIDAVVTDVHATNVVSMLREVELLIDGTDNLETRYLLNDAAVQAGLPWVYGACVGVEGRVLAIRPGVSACLRCVFPDPPPPGSLPTCDTAGILASAVHAVASLQTNEALKLLMGRTEALLGGLATVDVWRGRMHVLPPAGRDPHCPCCGAGRYEFLASERVASTTTLCGRNAVQILPADEVELDLRALLRRLPAYTHPHQNEFLVRFRLDELSVALFADGRAIIQGTTDPAVARTVYAKYIGT